jgi:pimeloyl-ACP methyl ester carboxylesterase
VPRTRVSRIVVATAAAVSLLAVPVAASAGVRAGHSHPSTAHKRVGSLELTRCDVLPGAWCGHLMRPWDPSGAVKGDISIGFVFLPASDQHHRVLGTVVPQEGGPGYATTDSAVDYDAMFGPLLQRRNMLLVDQRGTGRSEAIDCPALQNLRERYDIAAASCAKKLGDHADLYDSQLSADDESAVIRALQLGKVELYGDSYGTFFTQVFAGRHPHQIRSIVLDSAYPTTGESQWYPRQTPAMRSSFAKACRRSPACAAGHGTPMGLLRQVLGQVRNKPFHGYAYDADGVPHHVVVNGAALVAVAFGATYGPEYYREFVASLRSALHGDRAPLLRLVAENVYPSSYDGSPTAYSEGLDAAVTCADYPQLYNMADPPAERVKEYQASIKREQRRHPHVYAPFTIREYLASDWEEADWCLKWPSPSPAHPAGPPSPPSGHYPSVPTLILSGELDSITTPAEGALVAAKFPRSRQILIANSFHVTAEDNPDGCAVSVLRRFVAHPDHTLAAATPHCTRRVPPVRTLGRYFPSFTSLAPATAGPGNGVGVQGRRAATAAAETVADMVDRWSNNYTGRGVGLYGGTFRYTGGLHKIAFTLHRIRLERDLAVSGSIRWRPYRHRLSCHLVLTQLTMTGRTVSNPVVSGTLNSAWNTRRRGATAVLTGTLGGRHLDVLIVAP